MRSHSWFIGLVHLRPVTGILTALLLSVSLLAAPVHAGSGGPSVYWGAKAGPIDVPAPKVGTVAALQLPAGRYLVMAKAVVVGAGGSAKARPSVDCRLVLGSSVDSVIADPTWDGGDGSRMSILLTVAGRLRSPGKAKLRCVGAANDGDARIRDIRINAVRAGLLTIQKIGQPIKHMGSGRPRIVSVSSPTPTTIVGDNAWHSAGTFTLPSGRWWIMAKASARNSSSYAVNQCALYAGSDHDDLRFYVSLNGWAGSDMPLALQVVHWFHTPEVVTLFCRGSANFDVSNVTFSAIKAGRLTNIPLEAATGWSSGSGNPRIISGWSNGPVSIPKGSKFKTVRKVYLPKGHWMVLAKLWYEGDSMPATPVVDRTVSCMLEFGGDKDRVRARYGNNSSRFEPLVLSVVHPSTKDQPVKLKCRRTLAPGTGKGYFIKITAMRAGPLAKRHL